MNGPDDPDLVVAFLNTVDEEHGTDVLDDPAQWHAWAERHGLGEPTDVDRTRAVRDALRAALIDGTGELPEVSVRVLLDGRTPALAATDAVGRALAAAVRLAVAGEWGRIKVCPAHDCLWVFHDRSRNRSRTWCSMEACGNREKARQFRRRLNG